MTNEVKLELPQNRVLTVGDEQDLITLESLKNEPTKAWYFEKDDDNDEFRANPDGSITRARSVNVNGVKWIMPVQEQIQIPATIYEILIQSQQAVNKPSRVPEGMQKFSL